MSIDVRTLDFLRGVSALYVVINHVRANFFVGGDKIVSEVGWRGLSLYDYVGISLLQLTTLGQEFVVVFFVISGFAMAHSVRSSNSLKSFYKKRIIRLWPTYLLACILAVVVCGIFILISPKSKDAEFCRNYCTVYSFLMLISYINVKFPNALQFWSLPYEIIFYAICPLILRTRLHIVVTFIISCCATVIGTVLYGNNFLASNSILISFFLTTMLFFSTGAMLYYFLEKIPKVSFRTFVIIVGGSFFSSILIRFLIGSSNNVLSIFVVIITCFVIRNMSGMELKFDRIQIGSWSYSIYVFHYQFVVLFAFLLFEIFGVSASEIRGYGWWMLAILPVLLCCRMLYFVSERPCNRVLARMRASERS